MQTSDSSRFRKNQIIALPSGLELRQPFMFPETHAVNPHIRTVSEAKYNNGQPAASLDGRTVMITGVKPTELGYSVSLEDLFLYNATIVSRQCGFWLLERQRRTLAIEGTMLSKARAIGFIFDWLKPARGEAIKTSFGKHAAYVR